MQLRTGALDALTDLLLFLALQQLSFADVLEVDAHEVEVLARLSGCERLVLLLVFVILNRIQLSLRTAVLVAIAEVLWLVRFRIVFTEQQFGREYRRLVGFLAAEQPEFLRALAPVEQVRVTLGLAPVDQRVGVLRWSAPPLRYLRSRPSHAMRRCKSAAFR